MGSNEDGRQELLGLKVSGSVTETVSTTFISSLKERDIDGPRLVISDVHAGLT